MNIVLIGYRGTGKTTISRLLGQHLNLPCHDVDDEIQRAGGKTIAQIFSEQGEEAFRDLESQMLDQMCRRDGMVLAVGGGAVLREQNRRQMRNWGTVIWLQADAGSIYRRLQADPTTGDTRPALTAQGGLREIEQLLEKRHPLYEEAAHFYVDTAGKTPSQVSAEIVSLLQPPSA